MQGVELTGTNRSCGLVVLLFHLLRSKSTRPGSSAASAARHDTFACAYAKGFTFSGGYIGGVPPVPIPNTAVKPSRADGTARFPCGRVGRCRNFFPDAPPRECPRRGASLFVRLPVGALLSPLGDRSPVVPLSHTDRGVKPSRADGTARFPCGRVGRCRNFSPDAPPRFHTRHGASLFGRVGPLAICPQSNLRFRSTAEHATHAEAETSSQSSLCGVGLVSPRPSEQLWGPSFGDFWD